MVTNEGSFTLTGNAVLQNNDGASALYSPAECSLTGGYIRNNRAADGAAINHPGSLEISGGEISGNCGSGEGALINLGLYNSPELIIKDSVVIKNNRDAGGSGLCYVMGQYKIQGGTFENNAGTLFVNNWAGTRFEISGGTFSGNSLVVHSNWGSETLLSGGVRFVTETDVIEGPVRVEDNLSTTEPIRIRPESFELGYQAVRGDEALVATNGGIVISSNLGLGINIPALPEATVVLAFT